MVVVIGGLDPGGGAGLLRDVATAAARGARAHAVGTAWTEQGAGAHRVEPRPLEALRGTLSRALAERPAAVKIGMAVGPGTAAAIVESLAEYAGPVVVDPVLHSSRGGSLWEGTPRDLLPLIRRATLVTPNADEAAALTGLAVSTAADAEAAGRRLVESEGIAAVLVKGGHLAETAADITDVLVAPDGCWRFSRARLPGPSPRGTGCALATAIAVELGRGLPLRTAIETATRWLAGAIAAARPVGDERHL
jgi:hydroxymethylpyrimidine/phosphomethylpyrimidine kinase